jgi:hypothetical protein
MITVMKINNQFTTRFARLLLVQEGFISPSVLGLKNPNTDGDILSDLHQSPINNSERKEGHDKQR